MNQKKREKKKNFAPEEEQNIDSKREWTKKCDETVGGGESHFPRIVVEPEVYTPETGCR